MSTFFDSTLNKILKHAGKIGRDGFLTVESFVTAVCEYIHGDLGEPNEKYVAAMTELIEWQGTTVPALHAALLSYIRSHKPTFDDGRNIQKALGEITIAHMDDSEDVTPPELLKSVLADPSDGLKKCLQAKAGRGAVIQMGDEAALPFIPEGLDPKEALATITQEARNIREALLANVFGQDNAVNVFVSGIFQAKLDGLTNPNRVRPCATFLFAGPPGVGKTYLAQQAAKALKLPFARFDMSEYSHHEASIEFIGSDAVYRNSHEGNFTRFVKDHPRCIVLFDEVEKAHAVVTNLFLQMLDAGFIRDGHTDDELPLKDVLMIFTTNAGRQLYEDSESGDFSMLPRKVVLNALRRDINPRTGQPYFPAAICSRFASGNVVMFNRIDAADLSLIALRELNRSAVDFIDETGIDVSISSKVGSALLFAEGGAADARTVRGRAATFFSTELFELLRHASLKAPGGIAGVEELRMRVKIPEDNWDIRGLFEPREPTQVLIYASEEVARACAEPGGPPLLRIEDQESAAKHIREQEIGLVLVDPSFGAENKKSSVLDMTDANTPARGLLQYLRENCSGVPVYLLRGPGARIGREDAVSYLRIGVRGILDTGDAATFARDLGRLCSSLHRHAALNELEKSRKVLAFDTAQTLSPDGRTANIVLYDLRLETAVDAEDADSLLSRVSRPEARFSDVIGAEDAKEELRYFTAYLRDPKKYLGTGVRSPRGVLLYGPPGTGKTLLAKAMAGETGASFIAAQGNQFVTKLVGEGKDKVHKLFATARKYAPSILFVDEIDAVSQERGSAGAVGTGDALTAFLTEMDGFKSDPTRPVFVLAATNYGVEPGDGRSLDSALLRRFDRRIYVDLPTREERRAYIAKKFSENRAFAVSEDCAEDIAVRATGKSLADLESILELALRSAIRSGSATVTDEILDEAFESFCMGEEKKWDEESLLRTARHEAGHAYLSWKGGEKPSYATVVARGNYGGYVQYGDAEDKYNFTRAELLTRIRVGLGGRAAELIYYGDEEGLSSGAAADLRIATAQARRMLCEYGMDESFGLAVIGDGAALPDEVSDRIRAAVNRILDEQLRNALEELRRGRAAVDALVERLLEKNHLSGREIDRIFTSAGGN